jgi:hypothetical protein
MTREHDALRDLLAPVALGAAEPEEVARVEAHAAECAVCREELAGLRAGADVLALAVPQIEPPDGIRESLMATVRAEGAERRAAAPEGGTAPAPRRARGWRLPHLRPWPTVAVLATVAALLLGWNIALQTTSDSGGGNEVATLAVTGTKDAPGITGRVVYVPDEDTAVVRLSRLPQLEPGDAYQLWTIDAQGGAHSADLFTPEGPAEAVAVAQGLAGAKALAVTAQPATNRATPEGPILVTAALGTS